MKVLRRASSPQDSSSVRWTLSIGPPGGGDCRSWRIRPLGVPVIGKTMPFDKSS
jgi:hypothetical protein